MVERRGGLRRFEDMEARKLAGDALEAINRHVSTCEKQNEEVLERLKAQDAVLEPIRDSVRFIKIVAGACALILPLIEAWKAFAGP